MLLAGWSRCSAMAVNAGQLHRVPDCSIGKELRSFRSKVSAWTASPHSARASTGRPGAAQGRNLPPAQRRARIGVLELGRSAAQPVEPGCRGSSLIQLSRLATLAVDISMCGFRKPRLRYSSVLPANHWISLSISA